MINNFFNRCHNTVLALVLCCWAALFNAELTESNKRSEHHATVTWSAAWHTHACVEILVCSVFSDESDKSHDLWFTSPLLHFSSVLLEKMIIRSKQHLFHQRLTHSLCAGRQKYLATFLIDLWSTQTQTYVVYMAAFCWLVASFLGYKLPPPGLHSHTKDRVFMCVLNAMLTMLSNFQDLCVHATDHIISKIIRAWQIRDFEQTDQRCFCVRLHVCTSYLHSGKQF